MTEIRRWDSNELIVEGEGSIKELVEACAKLGNKSLAFADLYWADLYSANLRSADLSSADLRSADLRSADLRSADLRSADLRSADLYSADLRSADLRSADLRSANLSSANLSSANLRSADLRSANLSSADLSSANLRSARVPIWSKWRLAYSSLDGVITIHIGCKSKTIPEWDALFSEIHEDYDLALQHFTLDELGSVNEAKRIRAHYLAYKSYIEAMGGNP